MLWFIEVLALWIWELPLKPPFEMVIKSNFSLFFKKTRECFTLSLLFLSIVNDKAERVFFFCCGIIWFTSSVYLSLMFDLHPFFLLNRMQCSMPLNLKIQSWPKNSYSGFCRKKKESASELVSLPVMIF